MASKGIVKVNPERKRQQFSAESDMGTEPKFPLWLIGVPFPFVWRLS